VGFGDPFVDLVQQVILLHDPEPGQGTQSGADGDDINGYDIHPGSPLCDGFHVQTEAKADDAQQSQYDSAAQLGEAELEGFGDRLKHILQRADAGENHSGVEDNCKEEFKETIKNFEEPGVNWVSVKNKTLYYNKDKEDKISSVCWKIEFSTDLDAFVGTYDVHVDFVSGKVYGTSIGV